MRRIYFIGCLYLAVHAGGGLLKGQDSPPGKKPFSFTRLTAHWDEYSSDGYLKFLDEVKPEVAQVGFWGAHFWSLSATPHGKGYPAHFPVQGHKECSQWLANLNSAIHQRGIKALGHFNVILSLIHI